MHRRLADKILRHTGILNGAGRIPYGRSDERFARDPLRVTLMVCPASAEATAAV